MEIYKEYLTDLLIKKILASLIIVKKVRITNHINIVFVLT